MKQPKISVLMPIYNADKYLRGALASVIHQTLADIEIIAINDGSTDKSLDIIKQFSRDDKRIKIINKSNSGYGDSMNQGLTKATGQYIAILEPDDWIEPDMYGDLYSFAIKNKSDVVKSNCWKYYEKSDTNELWQLIKKDEAEKTIKPVDNQFIFSRPPSIWSAIYRRQFLLDNDIKFLTTPGASYQDTAFNFKVWAVARRATFTDKSYLHYRVDNADSSINNVAQKMDFVITEYDEIEKYLKQHQLWDKLASQMVYCKFLAYWWNIEYLPYGKMCRFIYQTSDNLASYLHNNLADRSLFNDTQWRNYTMWCNNPILFAINKQLHKIVHRFRK